MAAAASRLGAKEILDFGYCPLTDSPRVERTYPKFVFAHAMTCFLFGTNFGTTTSGSVDDYANWPGRDDKYRAWWSKEYVGKANKKGVAAAKDDLDLAAAAGLDAIGILVGPRIFLPNNFDYEAIQNIVKAAETHKVKIIPDFWDFFKPNADKEEQRYVLNFMAGKIVELMNKYPNAFYKRGTKPVICMGQPVRRGLYKEIEPLFNLFGGRENVYLIAGMVDLPYQNRGAGWVDGPDMLTAFEVHASWGDRVLDSILLPEMKNGKKICWPVSTSMYTNTGDMNRTCMAEGLGASRMIDQWRDALKYKSEAVYIASWNDFSEDHQITNSNYRGDTFMRLTKYFADWLRDGKAPEIKEDRLFIFHHRQLVDAKITEGKWRAVESDWQSTPSTDFVHVVSMLKEPGTLALTLGDNKLRLENVPAGFHEWLVYKPREKVCEKAHWNAGSYARHYPVADDVRSVTTIEKLSSCTPVATLSRKGAEIVSVSGRTDIAGTARFSDLCVVGNTNAAK